MSYLQRYPSVDTEHHHAQCLEGVHDECERRGARLRHTVERHHGDDHKVPWTCSIRSGYDDSQADGSKCHQCLHHGELRRKGEAEKGDVELKELACPDTQCI